MTPVCEHKRGEKFCPKCGKQLIVEPINPRFIAEQFYAAWMLKGFRDTLLGLFVRPGHLIRDYLVADRDLIVKPVLYLTLCATFFAWTNSHFTRDAICAKEAEWFCEWIFQHVAAMQTLQAVILTLSIKYIFFRKSSFGLMEIFAFSMYVLAQILLISALFIFISFHINAQMILGVSLLVRMLYESVATSQFFEAKSARDHLRAAAAVLTSVLLFFAVSLTAAVAVYLMMDSSS